MKKKFYFITIGSFTVIAILALMSVMINGRSEVTTRITDIRLFRRTPVWALAKAVEQQDVNNITALAKQHPDWLNVQDPTYGATLLYWAVGTERYAATEALLKAGADPNIGATNKGGITPLYEAAGYSHVDNDYKQDPKYVKLILKYGADPNKNYLGGDSKDTITDPGTSPLMHSICCGIEKTKALVEGGADINHKTKNGMTAATKALGFGEDPEYAHYLIVEKHARVTDKYSLGNIFDNQSDSDYARLPHEFYPVDDLRSWVWVYPIGSYEYKLKMEIVDEFKRQGIDYWATHIPAAVLNGIKKLYPDTWQEYIKKY